MERPGASELGAALTRSLAPVLLLLLFAFIGQQIVLQRGNTLHRNGRWQSSKQPLEQGVTGAATYLTTRSALRGGHLDLSDWHGFQEILYREPVQLARLELDFALDTGAQLNVILASTAEGFAAVRLSRYPEAPSACIQGGAESEFLVTRPLAAGDFDGGWVHLTLLAGDAGVQVLLDDHPVGRCDFATPLHGQVGFRGGYARTLVDDVEIHDARGTLVREGFSRYDGARRAFAGSLAIGVLGVVGVLWVRRRWGERGVSWQVYASATALVLVLSSALVWGVDRFYLSGLHSRNVDFASYPNRIESEEQVLERLRAQHAAPKPPGVRRILFVGTSQTWGAGARHEEDTFVARFQRRLDADPEIPPTECINLGISGLDAEGLLRHYREEWLALDPDVVVIDLGNNDRDPEILREALEQFIRIDAEHGIRTVLIPEPNTTEPDNDLGSLVERHAVVRELAREHDLPLIELQSLLSASTGAGFLWWDHVHLTSLGQRLVADRLWEERAKILAP